MNLIDILKKLAKIILVLFEDEDEDKNPEIPPKKNK